MLFWATSSASVSRSRCISRCERLSSKVTRRTPASSSAAPVVSIAISISFRRMGTLRSMRQGPGLPFTRVASRRSLELILIPARSAASWLISKRTLPPSRMKLMIPP